MNSVIDSIAELVELDKQVDFCEGEGLRQRWMFGRKLLERREGKKLPAGLLDELAEQTGKSRIELQKRVQFAEKFPTEKRLHNAIIQFKSWYAIVSEALPDPTSNRIVSSESNDAQLRYRTNRGICVAHLQGLSVPILSSHLSY